MTDVADVATQKRRRVALAIPCVVSAIAIVFLSMNGARSPPPAASGPETKPSVAASDAATTTNRHRSATRQNLTPRLGASMPLPEPDTPLVPIYADLKARADAGDAAAASRLYRDLHRCTTAPYELRELLRQEMSPEQIPADWPPERRAKAQAILEQNLAEQPARIQKARNDAAMCEGLAPEQRFVLPAMKRAAELGDPDAEICYMSGHDLWTRGVLDHPEWIAEYKADALAIAEAAVEHGNQAAVFMLAAAYSAERFNWQPLEQLIEPDPVRSYRYRKLAALASADGGAADARLAADATALAPKDRASADAWAQEMYVRHFGESRLRPTAVCEPDMTEELNTQLRASASAAKN